MRGPSQVHHIVDDFSPESGVTGMIIQLSRYLAGQGCATTVLTAAGRVGAVPSDVHLVALPLAAGGGWRFPRGLKAYLQALAPRPTGLWHLHGVWMGFQWLAAREAGRQQRPVLLSPHGMLNRWHLRHLGFKELRKLVYWHAVGYRAFKRVPVIHAVTPRERDELATWLPGRSIAVIPNAIDLEAMDQLSREAGDAATPPVDEPYVLSLGRLHPVKGLELLIEAFAQAVRDSPRRFRLVIAGPASDPAYAARLKALVRGLGIEQHVSFPGAVFGLRKIALYRQAWAFCAPSQTEVMGLVNLEAAALGVPVLTTHETGLWDWEAGGGVLVHPRVADLSRALTGIFAWSETERLDRGRQLRQLVENRYSWQAVGPQWLELYAGLAQG